MAPIRCPVCGRSFDPGPSRAMPFCSQRCRQIDLGRWLGERYAFACQSQPERPDETAPPEPPAAGDLP